ncbi:MAG: hypothetical protein JWP25_7567 [Bradyrhizobium sp.]|nr:hypothetical protein [Bradyrhizobium sp.]
MVRKFFRENDERIQRILIDSFPIFERFKWTLEDVEALDFSDFLLISDGVAALNQRDADEIAKIRAAQGK